MPTLNAPVHICLDLASDTDTSNCLLFVTVDFIPSFKKMSYEAASSCFALWYALETQQEKKNFTQHLIQKAFSYGFGKYYF